MVTQGVNVAVPLVKGLDAAAPLVKQGLDAAAPLARQGLDAAAPVVKQGLDAVGQLEKQAETEVSNALPQDVKQQLEGARQGIEIAGSTATADLGAAKQGVDAAVPVVKGLSTQQFHW